MVGFNNRKRRDVVAIDFVTVSNCDQLVVGPTHARGGTCNFLMTDVRDLEQVVVVTHIGSTDHSFLSAVISVAKAVPNMSVS